jgi:hypothetical protein
MQGLDPSDTKSGIVYLSEVKRRNEKGQQTNEIEGYALSQVLTVKSAQVLKVDAAAGKVSALLGEGVMLQAADASGISEQSREDTASIAKKVTVDYAMK